MHIFNHKTVVGLFDSDQDVEQAVAQLQESGFGQEDDNALRIIDRHRLTQESPIDAPGQEALIQPQQGLSASGPAVIYNPITEAGTEANNVERYTHQALTDSGLGDEEASFYARQVARDNSLVLVETTKERAAEAANIMSQAGARTLES